MVAKHIVDVGDPQVDMRLARCSCGAKFRVEDADDMSDVEYHAELMTLAYGHVYANAWMVEES